MYRLFCVLACVLPVCSVYPAELGADVVAAVLHPQPEHSLDFPRAWRSSIDRANRYLQEEILKSYVRIKYSLHGDWLTPQQRRYIYQCIRSLGEPDTTYLTHVYTPENDLDPNSEIRLITLPGAIRVGVVLLDKNLIDVYEQYDVFPAACAYGMARVMRDKQRESHYARNACLFALSRAVCAFLVAGPSLGVILTYTMPFTPISSLLIRGAWCMVTPAALITAAFTRGFEVHQENMCQRWRDEDASEVCAPHVRDVYAYAHAAYIKECKEFESDMEPQQRQVKSWVQALKDMLWCGLYPKSTGRRLRVERYLQAHTTQHVERDAQIVNSSDDVV